MLEYAKGFYTSKEWKTLSKLYMSSINYVCERCGGVAEICHHKKYITPKNINDRSITLNIDNLEGLCMNCHNKEHKRKYNSSISRPIFDSDGNMVAVKDSKEIEEYKQAVHAIDNIDINQLKGRYAK